MQNDQSPQKHKANLELLSKHCGVSIATIHRYLQKPHLLKESTYNSIKQQLLDSDFADIMPAKSSLQNIALFVNDSQSFMTSDIIRCTQGILNNYNMHIILIDTQVESELYTTLLKYKRILSNINGVIAYAFNTYISYKSIEKKYNIPIVCINSQGNKHGTTFNTNDYRGAQNATQYLIDKGYTRIGFVGWDLEDKTLYDRYIGWKHVCEKNKVEHSCSFSPISPDGGYYGCEDIMLSFEPDAVFFACDAMALGGIGYLNEHSIIIGKQLGVMGFDDITASKFLGLSTMHQFIEDKACKAVKYIIDYYQNKESQYVQELSLTPIVIERRSTQRE